MPDIGLIKDFIAGFCATLAMQPLVNTKLAVQRSEEKLNSDDSFLKREYDALKEEFLKIINSEDAHAGGLSYASRGALTKALMFLGFDSVDDALKEMMPEINGHFRQVSAGSLSGAFQGMVVLPLEWYSTQRSLNPDKTPKESVDDIKDYARESGASMPVALTAARNSVFDSVFNVLKESGVPYGPAVVVSMSASYLFEKGRSLSQQSKMPEEVKAFFKEKFESGKDGAEDVFKGWGAKAAEFAMVYFLLQTIKSFKDWLKSGDPEKPASPPVKEDSLGEPEKT